MNSKFFALENLPNVVIFRDKSENDSPCVKIRAIKEEDEEDIWLEEDIIFQSRITAKSFVKNYSKEQAREWVEEEIGQNK